MKKVHIVFSKCFAGGFPVGLVINCPFLKPHKITSPEVGDWCKVERKRIPNENEIPEWCPLDEVKT